MKSMRYPVIVALLFLLIAQPAYAYLDPGAGSMAFQALIALFLGATATGKLWWSKVKGFFSGKSSRNGEKDE